MSDEIIAEVRDIKDAIGAKFNYDLRALFEEIKRGEAELQAKGVHLVSPPSNPASLHYSALQLVTRKVDSERKRQSAMVVGGPTR